MKSRFARSPRARSGRFEAGSAATNEGFQPLILFSYVALTSLGLSAARNGFLLAAVPPCSRRTFVELL
ncbi:hypothetical protein [Ferrovum myxofaciens]|uniref:hypothetical protein n=1 Tax=Ferrovum myxofaciens TaxID=416213 RepID=UPI002357258B|nr:hypothetical protein [Ferrovum myxofaciens]